MSINPAHFRALVTGVLEKAEYHRQGIYTPSAVELLLGTAAVESDFGTNIYQLGGGPGRGFFQMESATEVWLWSYMETRPELKDAVTDISNVTRPCHFSMESNIAYMILMARIRYLPYPYPLPSLGNVDGLAQYWKQAYNTVAGDGFLTNFVQKYQKYCI